MHDNGLETAVNMFEETTDRTLCWTLSFYIAAGQLPETVGAAIVSRMKAAPDAADGFASLLASDPAIGVLHRAMTPLFNDISNEQWVSGGRSEEYLIGVGGGPAPQHVALATPTEITWTVEGQRVVVAPGPIGPQSAFVRRFWYVHNNGAVSWHLSFSIRYEHTPAHFHFLTMLQQVVSPTALAATGDQRLRAGAPLSPPFRSPTGLQPLDEVTIATDGGVAPFWNAVVDWFNFDAPRAFDMLAGTPWRAHDETVASDPWRVLVRHEQNPEIPGLALPVCRSLFFFDDTAALRALLPKLDRTTNTVKTLEEQVRESEWLTHVADNYLSGAATENACRLDETFWLHMNFAAAAHNAGKENVQNSGDETRLPDYLLQRFMAGFNQCQVDFVRLGANETLDALQSIEFQDGLRQHAYLRFANARAMYQYASASRSRMVGMDSIGTCPYAFLIHASLLHNECLAVDFQRDSARTLRDIQSLIDADKAGSMDVLNGFRLGEESRFRNAFHTNLFRFDSEADAFDQIEHRRGVARLVRNVEGRVEILERQLPVFEERLRRQRDKAVSYAIAAVGAFGLFQLVLQTVDMLHPVSAPWRLPAVWVSSIGSGIIMVAFVIVVVADLWSLRPRRDAKKRTEIRGRNRP